MSNGASGLDIGLEAAVRRMIDLRHECLAAVWSVNGRVRYSHRGREFPFVTCKPKDGLPKDSIAARAAAIGKLGFTSFHNVPSYAWTDRTDLEVREQTRVGTNWHAVTLLWIDDADAEDDDPQDDVLPELGAPRFR